MKAPLRYLLALALTPLLLAVMAVCLAVAVDPYRFFGTPSLNGWTALKPRAYQQAGLAKTYMLARNQPATLLLGNSRVEVGLDPESRYWPTEFRPVFNAALAGHDLFSALLFLQDDIAQHPPKLVALGVDFQDFIQAGADPTDPASSAAELRMFADRNGNPNPQRNLQFWDDAVTATLTIDALTDSLMTLALQSPAADPTMTARGFNPLHDYRAAVRREGAFALFAQKQAMYEAQYRGFSPSEFSDPRSNPQFRYLVAIAKSCAARHVSLVVFTYPYHAEYFAMLRRLGLWPSFQAWKRALTDALDELAARPGSDIRLFDFAQSDRFSSEPVPAAGDRRTQMRWYWESGHFKSALGEKLIARMMGEGDEIGTLLVGHENPISAADAGATRLGRLPLRPAGH